MHWGFEPSGNKKRKFDGDQPFYVKKQKLGGDGIKKHKLFSTGDKMIYAIGNEIHFTAGINKQTVEKIIRKITKIINSNHDKFKDSDEKLEIAYVVDSPGGCVTSILKFVDFIKMTKKKYPYVEFISVATGMVASAGTIMCVCADKRYMTKNAHAMIHELSAGSSGKYQHLMSYSKYLTNLHDALLNIYLEKCSLIKENLEKLLTEETWFNAEEYLALGFVEKLIDT